jgi:hypothetical protein
MGLFILQVSATSVKETISFKIDSFRKIGDSVPVVAIILLLFALPIELNFWCFRSNSRHGKANESMLSWPFIREKMPWGLVLLLGNNTPCK